MESCDVWAVLETRNLLRPRLRIWYSVALESRSFLALVWSSAAGLLCLAAMPDAAMSEAYGEKLTRTICCAASLYMFMGCFRLVGARKVLNSSILHRYVDDYGAAANEHMKWYRVEPHTGRLFDGLLVTKVKIATFFTIGALAGLALAGLRASPWTLATWATAGIVLQMLSAPTLFATRLLQAISKVLVLNLLNDVARFPKDTACSDESFWQCALVKYEELDRSLRGLWGSASYLFVPHFGAMFVMSACSVALGVQAIHTGNIEAELLSIISLIWCLMVTLRDLFALSSITSLCNAKSTFEEDSIFAAAFCKLGANRMTSRQREDHWTFLQAVEMSPAGARLFILVDTMLLTRIAVPMVTADATLISYMLATLEIRL